VYSVDSVRGACRMRRANRGGRAPSRVMALAALWAGLFVSLPAMAADLPSPAPPIFVQSGSFNPSGFELRGGVLASTAGPETGEVNLNAELVLPRFYTLPGWQ